MPDWFLYLLLTLAVYRVWRLVGRDDITEFLRRPLPEKVREGVQCSWCLGSWLAVAGVYLLHRYVQELSPHWLLWAIAVACGVGLLERVDE